MDKILGIYEVVERISDNEFICKKGILKFNITKILKDDKESIYSHKAQNLSSIQHKNLINISIDEDEKYFYAIREELEPQEFDKLDTSIFLEYSEDIRYQKLIECYLQIFEAIKYIHSQGLYHGNINTDNVLVNRQNEVFLLDFGKSYFYGLLGYDNTRFHSPEQLGFRFTKSDIDSKTDIFSFGLCMLKLLVGIFEDFNFSEYYNTPDDLYKIFKAIENDYELNDIDNDLFVLIKKMTVINPNDRIPLSDLGQELINILSKTRKTYRFEINLQPKVAQDYREIHDITITEVIDDIESKIEKGKSYWSFGLDKEGNREEIKIACGDFIFCCSTREGHYLFCFRILENPKEFDKLYSNGVEFYNDFSITIGGNHNSKCDNVQNIKDELKERFELQKLRNKYLEIDKKAVATEEELLIAEKKTIEQKKNTKLALLKSIDKGSDMITFELIPSKNKNERDDIDDIIDDENSAKESGLSKKDRDFKPKDKVLIDEKDRLNSRTIYGEVATLKPDKKDIVINVGKYKATNLKMDKNKIYQISYDFQVEEILWNKKNKALEELKNGNAQIPNIMRKINEPKELQPNTLIEIEKFFDEMLDENQKEAVIKTMSLDNGSEILLIQGPPGTGKTTTITEMLLQLLDRHRHWKILVASQSNQAVDNVLEKVCQKEEKILRIGNRSSGIGGYDV